MEANLKLDKLLSYFGTNKNKLGQATGKRQTFYDISKGQIKSFSAEVVAAIKKVYPQINERWLLYDEGEMILPTKPFKEQQLQTSVIAESNKKYEALDQLNKIQNGKGKPNTNKIITDDEIIKIKTFIIPMKGFAGLKNAIYDDQYITENFEQSTVEVPKHLYSPISYRIQSSGKSMPNSIPENAWVTAVPIPEMIWMTYKFMPDKIYVLFHPYRGILFKHVKNLPFDEIELSSQNDDKDEFPDEKFRITEFRKILLAIKVENFI